MIKMDQLFKIERPELFSSQGEQSCPIISVASSSIQDDIGVFKGICEHYDLYICSYLLSVILHVFLFAAF